MMTSKAASLIILAGLAHQALTAVADNASLAPTERTEKQNALRSDAACGLRCVDFVLVWHGRQSVVKDLIETSREPDGASLSYLKSLLVMYGLQYEAVKVTDITLLSLTSPAPLIVHLKPEAAGAEIGHYVVVFGADGAFLKVWDSIDGVTLISGSPRVLGAGVMVASRRG